MNTEHRYKFEKGSKKHNCPSCTKRRFVRYLDTTTNEYLPERYGRCDRESKCGYFLSPFADGYAKAIWEQEQGNKPNWKPQTKPQIKPVVKPSRVYIPDEVFKRTRSGYSQNVFIQNLLTRVAFPFTVADIEKVISQYHLGTVQNGYRKGASTFSFIDAKGKVRAIQVKQFDEQNHTTGTDFLHSIIEKHYKRNNKQLPAWLEAYQKNETKVSCLFGEHLLSKYPQNPVALVEAPKTAIYGTLFFGFPEQPTNLIWLAVYNLSSLNLNKCKALKGRDVFLFPDLSKDGNAFKLWSNRANQIQKQLAGTRFIVSDLLEQLATRQDKEQGKDIADYLIQQDWQLFRKKDIQKTPTLPPEPVELVESVKGVRSAPVKTNLFFSTPEPLPVIDEAKPEPIILRENWNNEIAELEKHFAGITPTRQPIALNKYTAVRNCTLFIESHLATLKANNGKRTFLPYLHRLRHLKEILTTKKSETG